MTAKTQGAILDLLRDVSSFNKNALESIEKQNGTMRCICAAGAQRNLARIWFCVIASIRIWSSRDRSQPIKKNCVGLHVQ